MEPVDRRALGLPTSGRGAVAGLGRRLAAVTLDWLLSLVIARGFFGSGPWQPLAVFAAENVVLVATLGTTVGHRLLGIRVIDVSGGLPRPLPVLVRTALLCLAIPALVWDRDGRGLHDRAAGTVVIRWR